MNTKEKLLEILVSKNLSICTCESLTGGMIASALTNLRGASAVFKGSLVLYQKKSKAKILKVNDEYFANYGTVSEETAILMADSAQRIFDSDISIGITGVAGPDVIENKPLGLIHLCCKLFDKTYCFRTKLRGTNRIENKILATSFALSQIYKILVNLIKK